MLVGLVKGRYLPNASELAPGISTEGTTPFGGDANFNYLPRALYYFGQATRGVLSKTVSYGENHQLLRFEIIDREEARQEKKAGEGGCFFSCRL